MKVNQLKAGVILTYLSMGTSMLVSLLYTPVMLSILGQSEYGTYTLANSVIANLSILNFGFGSAYIRFYSRYKSQNDNKGVARLNGMFMVVFTVIAIVALAAGMVLTSNAENIFKEGLSAAEIRKTQTLMKIAVVNISISFPVNVFTSYITANEKYVFIKVVNMIKTVLSPLITLPILLLGYGSVGMVVITLVVNVIADILSVVFSFKRLNIEFDFKKFDLRLLKEVWVFSFYIFLNLVTDMVNWNVDKFLLGMLQSTVMVAIYGVAGHINSLYINIFRAVSNVFIPRINNIVEQNRTDDALTRLFVKIGRIQFMVLALILNMYLFFGEYFITKWAGADYAESYIVGAILIFSVTIEGIQTIARDIQRAKNLHKFQSITYLLIALANIVISFPLCIKYGAIGVASGTAISLITGNIIMNTYYHKKVGLDVICFWKSILSIFPSFILPVVYGVIVNEFFPVTNIVMLIVHTSIMFVLYCSSLWMLGMNKEEKNIFSTPLQKLLRRNVK